MSASATAISLRCQDIFSPAAATTSLRRLREIEIASMTRREIKKRNSAEISAFGDFRPFSEVGRASSIPLRDLERLLESARTNPVTQTLEKSSYEVGDIQTGFCFGRAAYFHFMLLRLGLQESSIRKVWAVGPIAAPSGEITWKFHVATLAYSRERGWMALDVNEAKPQLLRHWVAEYQERSIDERVRFYVTEGSRFSVDIPSYSRLELGLNLSREDDAYRGFFQDLMTSMRKISLGDLGLQVLPREKPVPITGPKVSPLVATRPAEISFWRRLFF